MYYYMKFDTSLIHLVFNGTEVYGLDVKGLSYD